MDKDENHIFSNIIRGYHDGYVIDKIGWSHLSIIEKVGIEEFVAYANHGTELEFYAWICEKVGSELRDWEAVSLELHKIWFEQNENYCNDEGPRCWFAWRLSNSDDSAVYSRPEKVFALRHKSWDSLKDKNIREFFVRRQYSYAEALLDRDSPGLKIKPSDIQTSCGFIVRQENRYQSNATADMFPVSTLFEAIESADILAASGVNSVTIFECQGLGLRFTTKNREHWLRMAKLDKEFGFNSCMRDLYHLAR